MRGPKYIGIRRPHFRPAKLWCGCGQEEKKPGLVVGPACWAAAPKTLHSEIYSQDKAVALAAARSLIDFSVSRRPAKPGRES